jgi:membrane protein required for beta-lactamase induction
LWYDYFGQLIGLLTVVGWMIGRASVRLEYDMIAEAFRRSSVRRLLAYDKATVEKMKTGQFLKGEKG